MAPSYVSLRTKQLLSETFLSTGFSFRDIGLDHLKHPVYSVFKNDGSKIPGVVDAKISGKYQRN